MGFNSAFKVLKVKAKWLLYVPPCLALRTQDSVWVLKKREEQRLEAAQMKFMRHLFGITKLDKEEKQCIRGKKREHRTQ